MKDFKIERLQFVRDLFIFSCYTGHAYTDVIQLTPSNIVCGIDGNYWIKTLRQKTEVSVNVPLLTIGRQIITKYKDDPRAIVKGSLFPKFLIRS